MIAVRLRKRNTSPFVKPPPSRDESINKAGQRLVGVLTGQLIAVDGGAGLMDAALPLEIQQVVPQSAATQ
jgi:hypothetical protein